MSQNNNYFKKSLSEGKPVRERERVALKPKERLFFYPWRQVSEKKFFLNYCFRVGYLDISASK